MHATRLLTRHMVATKPSAISSTVPSHRAPLARHTASPCQGRTSHPTARPRLCATSALPATAVVVVPEPEPSGPAVPPFLDDLARTPEGPWAPPLPTNLEAIIVMGVKISLAPFAEMWAADDLRHCGWNWLTLPSPSHPYRSKVDEEGMYVEPRFSQRLKAHLENRPLYGHY